MFTFRFEADGEIQNIAVFQAGSYRRSNLPCGSSNIMIPNENGVEILHPVGKQDDAYDRCFVMNDNGATIDKIFATDGRPG